MSDTNTNTGQNTEQKTDPFELERHARPIDWRPLLSLPLPPLPARPR